MRLGSLSSQSVRQPSGRIVSVAVDQSLSKQCHHDLFSFFLSPVQMRMSRKTPADVQALMLRAQKPLAPLHPPKRIRVADLTFRLARGQISSTTAPWLVLPDKSLPKPKLAREAFPKPPKAAGNNKANLCQSLNVSL